MALPYTRDEVKERARAEWKGACNVTLPSFTADFSGLNETAIRHDVRRAAELGYWGTLVASESGTSNDEYVRFLEIAADEAGEDLRIVAHLSFSTVEEELAAAAAAESIGVEAALLSYPPGFVPRSAAEVAEHTAHVAERTDLALILFAVSTWGFKSLHPAGFPMQVLGEMAKLPTAAALKYEGGGPALVSALTEVQRICGEDVIVENPLEHQIPAQVAAFGTRWFGTSGYESLGDRVPRMLAMLHEDRFEEAMELFWSCAPARESKGAFHATFAGAHLIHRVGWKYLGWLQGFNGGLLRMPQMRLLPGQMKALRAGLEAAGFDVPPSDDDFYAGRHPA
jgi:4-hydroxy-tetrahydrodipicolinate synthase